MSATCKKTGTIIQKLWEITNIRETVLGSKIFYFNLRHTSKNFGISGSVHRKS